MTILSFTYTKQPGFDVTRRVVIPLVSPGKNYFTIDVSDLDIEDQVAVDREIQLLNDERTAKIDQIMAEFDIRTNFRSFNPEKMSNIVEE